MSFSKPVKDSKSEVIDLYEDNKKFCLLHKEFCKFKKVERIKCLLNGYLCFPTVEEVLVSLISEVREKYGEMLDEQLDLVLALQKEAGSLKEGSSTLEKENNYLNEKNKELKEENKELKEKTTNLEEEVKDLNEKNNDLKEENKELKEKTTNLEEAVKDLKDDIKVWRQDFSSSHDLVLKLEGEVKELKMTSAFPQTWLFGFLAIMSIAAYLAFIRNRRSRNPAAVEGNIHGNGYLQVNGQGNALVPGQGNSGGHDNAGGQENHNLQIHDVANNVQEVPNATNSRYNTRFQAAKSQAARSRV